MHGIRIQRLKCEYDRGQVIEGVESLRAPVVDFSSLVAEVEPARDSKNIPTAAMVVNSQVNQGRIAA